MNERLEEKWLLARSITTGVYLREIVLKLFFKKIEEFLSKKLVSP